MVAVPPSEPAEVPSTIETPDNCWPLVSDSVDVDEAKPGLVTTIVNEAGDGRLRRVNAPTSPWVTLIVRITVVPVVAVTVAPPSGPDRPTTCPEISPLPFCSWIWMPVRDSPPDRSSGCTWVA